MFSGVSRNMSDVRQWGCSSWSVLSLEALLYVLLIRCEQVLYLKKNSNPLELDTFTNILARCCCIFNRIKKRQQHLRSICLNSWNWVRALAILILNGNQLYLCLNWVHCPAKKPRYYAFQRSISRFKQAFLGQARQLKLSTLVCW